MTVKEITGNVCKRHLFQKRKGTFWPKECFRLAISSCEAWLWWKGRPCSRRKEGRNQQANWGKWFCLCSADKRINRCIIHEQFTSMLGNRIAISYQSREKVWVARSRYAVYNREASGWERPHDDASLVCSAVLHIKILEATRAFVFGTSGENNAFPSYCCPWFSFAIWLNSLPAEHLWFR